MNIRFVIFSLLLLSLFGCGNGGGTANQMNEGELKLGVDNSYSLLMQSIIPVYENTYNKAHVVATYASEEEILRKLYADSIQEAILSRPLTEEELNYFKSQKKFPEQLKIAVDAIAFIVHPENPDTVFTIKQIEEVMAGRINTWSGIQSGNSTGEIRVVFPESGSGERRYVKESILKNSAEPSNLAVKNVNELIDYVSQNKGAIGVISGAWISDEEDQVSQDFRGKIKIIRVIDSTNVVDPRKPFGPAMGYIAMKEYPYRRDVWAIRTGLTGSVATHFLSFLANEDGQRIVRTMGMVPVKMDIRLIQIKE